MEKNNPYKCWIGIDILNYTHHFVFCEYKSSAFAKAASLIADEYFQWDEETQMTQYLIDFNDIDDITFEQFIERIWEI